MSMIKNKVQLIGHLGHSPEIRVLEGGKKLATMSLATKENYKDTSGTKVTETQWHHIVAWGKHADFAEKFLAKGLHVAVDGKLFNRNYIDKNGAKRVITEIHVHELLIITPKK